MTKEAIDQNITYLLEHPMFRDRIETLSKLLGNRIRVSRANLVKRKTKRHARESDQITYLVKKGWLTDKMVSDASDYAGILFNGFSCDPGKLAGAKNPSKLIDNAIAKDNRLAARITSSKYLDNIKEYLADPEYQMPYSEGGRQQFMSSARAVCRLLDDAEIQKMVQNTYNSLLSKVSALELAMIMLKKETEINDLRIENAANEASFNAMAILMKLLDLLPKSALQKMVAEHQHKLDMIDGLVAGYKISRNKDLDLYLNDVLQIKKSIDVIGRAKTTRMHLNLDAYNLVLSALVSYIDAGIDKGIYPAVKIFADIKKLDSPKGKKAEIIRKYAKNQPIVSVMNYLSRRESDLQKSYELGLHKETNLKKIVNF